ncbi:hypothetical protein ABL78_5227 [Leptomonas seymouri]|uniref:Uncharacterized protein n=1 Tax=Leptomonas seymouri TaxID=5684 RepID=A0A0N1IJH1_LEPSE|nr:hypothetical protein ABL78_5227 [Leptomonas seymouri]|eukprot:KPI85695.1 hypothetical protein ABL78_5227 [Leptomonas seymouri]
MNALGDRCHSVIVLTDTAHLEAPLLATTFGYHVGCVLTSANAGKAPSSEDIVQYVTSFCRANKVTCAVSNLCEQGVCSLPSSAASVIQWLTAPVTLVDATHVKDVPLLNSFLSWLYGDRESSVSTLQGASSETPYTLVAVLDVSRGALCTPSSDQISRDAYAWLRPTPSYYSELMEATNLQRAASANAPCPVDLNFYVFPVQVYSRYPVVRDRGLQEGRCEEGTTLVPVEQWVNKSSLDALLRELAFKAGQLAKYGA